MGTITDDQLQGSDTLPSTFTPSGFTTVPSATANITTSTGPTSQGFLTPAYPSTSTSLKASTSTGVASTPTGVPHASQSSIATGLTPGDKAGIAIGVAAVNTLFVWWLRPKKWNFKAKPKTNEKASARNPKASATGLEEEKASV